MGNIDATPDKKTHAKGSSTGRTKSERYTHTTGATKRVNTKPSKSRHKIE